MSHLESARAFLHALDEHRLDRAERLLSLGAQVEGPDRVYVAREEFLELQRAIAYAVPDLRCEVLDLSERGPLVVAAVRISGTHEKDLVVPGPTYRVVPATGAPLDVPPSLLALAFELGRISTVRSIDGPGLLAPLGGMGLHTAQPGVMG